MTFHDLRHAYGSRLASRGLTARQIADAMGHKKTSTTEIYIQRYDGEAADERIREAMTGDAWARVLSLEAGFFGGRMEGVSSVPWNRLGTKT